MANVFVYAEDGERLVDRCEGANWSGGCPRSPPGRLVLCAGRKVIVLGASGGIRMALAVEPDAVSCPLAALHLFSPRSADCAPPENPSGQFQAGAWKRENPGRDG